MRALERVAAVGLLLALALLGIDRLLHHWSLLPIFPWPRRARGLPRTLWFVWRFRPLLAGGLATLVLSLLVALAASVTELARLLELRASDE